MNAAQVVRVSLLESERLLTEWLTTTLSLAGMQLVGVYPESPSFLQGLSSDRPDVALADLRTDADDDGAAIRLLREIVSVQPELPVVVLSRFSHPNAELCHRHGAAAWVDTASASVEQLIATLRDVAGGARLAPPAPAVSRPIREAGDSGLMPQLTEREREVLGFIGEGADNLKIAALLGIRERTVKSYVTGLYRKTHAENRTQLAILALELGVRPPLDAAERSRPVVTGAQLAPALDLGA
jgi:two-component system, NarL family, nitrate/nitrite response regulator NarL